MGLQTFTDPDQVLITGPVVIQQDLSQPTTGKPSLTVNGILAALGAVLQGSSTPAASIPTPTGAGVTIATGNVINRVAPSGACTAAILAAGTVNGQIAVVTNESTVVANTITFSTTLATGLILTDATPDAHVIKASSGAIFAWFTSLNAGAGAWVRVGPFGG